MRERSKLPPDANIRYAEWRIITGDMELFQVQGVRFDKIMLVLGEENISWVFYQNTPPAWIRAAVLWLFHSKHSVNVEYSNHAIPMSIHTLVAARPRECSTSVSKITSTGIVPPMDTSRGPR